LIQNPALRAGGWILLVYRGLRGLTPVIKTLLGGWVQCAFVWREMNDQGCNCGLGVGEVDDTGDSAVRSSVTPGVSPAFLSLAGGFLGEPPLTAGLS